MYIVINLCDFQYTNVFFKKAVKNKVIDNSIFYRIIYSDSIMCTTGLFIKIPITIQLLERFHNNYKCTFTVQDNENTINELEKIEHKILDLVNIKKKKVKYGILNQLRCGTMKFYTNHLGNHISGQYIIKISGVWETEKNYGVTYKILHILN